MQLTKQANYAVRTLIYCAVNEPDHSRVNEISKAYAISELSLFKYIKPLVDKGFLKSIRGRNGGLKLARPAKDITMAEVVRATEESFNLAECMDEKEIDCPLVGNCMTNKALGEALAAFFAVLENYTIEDLSKRDKMLRDLLSIDEHTPVASAAG